MRIRTVTTADTAALAPLRHDLWPEGSVAEHAAELPGVLADAGSEVFVAEEGGRIVGWAEVRLRSHADGCETSPVGYLEGWYVAPAWRRKGVGASLVAAFEAWARDRGCAEVASDTGLDNEASQAAHLRLGYEVSDRAVRFRKSLESGIVQGPRTRPPLPAEAAAETGGGDE
jgi:aminoglycoside 6'-N-acetyltransferase I